MRSSVGRAVDVAAARRRLIEKRDALLLRHHETVHDESELLEASEPDLPDVAANRTAAALLDRLGDAELMQLRRIAGALARLDDGNYGRCVVCGSAIAAARLEVMPEAERCESCHNSH